MVSRDDALRGFTKHDWTVFLTVGSWSYKNGYSSFYPCQIEVALPPHGPKKVETNLYRLYREGLLDRRNKYTPFYEWWITEKGLELWEQLTGNTAK